MTMIWEVKKEYSLIVWASVHFQLYLKHTVIWKDLYQRSVDFSRYEPWGQNGGGGDDGEILKAGSRAQAFCTMVILFSQKLVPSTIGVLVPDTASSLPSRLKVSICPGTLRRGFPALKVVAVICMFSSSRKVLCITELSSEEQWKVVLLLNKKYLLSAYYGPGSVQVLYTDELIYVEGRLLPSVYGWGN